MDRDLTCRIAAQDAGMKIEEYLKRLGCSHHVLTHLKRTDHGIVLNGSWAYASQRLAAGDELTLHVTEETASEQILPVPLPLHIVYEDEDLMVVDKAPDMPIHPSVHNHDNTLANGIVHYFASRQLPFVYRCVNRLDRDTSGLLIIAKNMLSAAILYQMSADRSIHRQYLAVAEGCTPLSGTITAPIARKPDSAIMRCVDPVHGETAVTHFERLAVGGISALSSLCGTGSISASSSPCGTDDVSALSSPCGTGGISASASPCASGDALCLSLLRIRLETGRTHQIRVHLTSIGHPLAGDFLYNPGSAAPIGRQALHSWSLDFLHPITKEPLHFRAGLPDDMAQLLASAGLSAGQIQALL